MVVIFDPEGVLTETDGCRYAAWEQMAREQGILYDQAMDAQLRTLDAAGQLQGVLSRAHRSYSPAERLALLTRQNDLFDEQLEKRGEAALRPGAEQVLLALRRRRCSLAAVMTGGLPGRVLCHLSIGKMFDVISRRDGLENQLADVRRRLNAAPRECLLVTVYPDSAKTARRMEMLALLCAHTEEQEAVLQQILAMLAEYAVE